MIKILHSRKERLSDQKSCKTSMLGILGIYESPDQSLWSSLAFKSPISIIQQQMKLTKERLNFSIWEQYFAESETYSKELVRF
jgi:hypothetical protein